MSNVLSARFKRIFMVFMAGFLLLAGNGCDIYAPKAKIAILSDLHYFDTALLINDGSAFQEYLLSDRKLLKESSAILDSAIAGINQENVDIVIIAGDLTKDGELACHTRVAERLHELKTSGKKVYVIPGNHDINNPHALSYNGDEVAPVPFVTPEQFRDIYKDFGYSQAIARDKNSLSYVVEPVPGLCIIAMDSCKYADNASNGEPEVSGAFSEKTQNWIEHQLKKARSERKTVFGVMHHGILEHYQGQNVLFPEYVIDDNASAANRFADLGMQIVFTGHYHAQDITRTVTRNGNSLYDIETGSLLTAPCPYRILDLDESQTLTITSKKVESIDYSVPAGMTFQDYADTFLAEGMQGLVYYMLTSGTFVIDGNPIVLTAEDAQQITPLLVNAFAAHYQGDEQPDMTTLTIIQQLMNDADPLKQLMGQALGGLWTDLEPADNTLKIDLNSGDIIQ